MAAQELYSTPLYSDANLVAYYRLEDTSDSKGTRTLTNNNSVTFDSAVFNNGADLGTANTNKTLTYFTDNYGISGGAFSIVGWIYLPSSITSANHCFLCVSDGTTYTDGYIEYQYNSGSPQILFQRGRGSTGDEGITYAYTMPAATWTHFALTYDGTDVRAYINGVAVGGAVAASGNGSAHYTNGFAIGDRVFDSGLLGNISSIKADDVAVFSRALTSTEVSKLYNGFSTAWTQTCTESITLTDSLTRSTVRSLFETLSLTDVLAAGKIKIQTLLESITLIDTLPKSLARTLTESIALTDTLVKSPAKNLTESISLTDTLTRSITRVLTEKIVIVDVVRKFINGLLAIYSNKYTKQNTTYSNKYTTQGTTYTNKYNHLQ